MKWGFCIATHNTNNEKVYKLTWDPLSPLPIQLSEQACILQTGGRLGAFLKHLAGLVVNMEMHHPEPPPRNDRLHSCRGTCQLLQVSGSAAESPLTQAHALPGMAHIQWLMGVGSQRCPFQPIWDMMGDTPSSALSQHGLCSSLISSFCPVLFPFTVFVLDKRLSLQFVSMSTSRETKLWQALKLKT